MENINVAFELTSASWEQWIGAALRQAHFERLRAAARLRRRRRPNKSEGSASCTNLLWLLAASAIGFWLLRC